MKIEKISIDKIKPAEYNPRLDLKPGDIEYEKIKRSIDEFDLVEPLVWNKTTGNLVGGHQRFKILKEKGVQEFDVSVVEISDVNREKALNIALNKAQGDWDNLKLQEILKEMEMSSFDLTLTGFDKDEFDELIQRNNEIFQSNDIENQSRLDKKANVICPECGHEFAP